MMIDPTDLGYWIGLVTCIAGALIAQAELVGEPWRHVLSVIFITGTAATGYLLHSPRQRP